MKRLFADAFFFLALWNRHDFFHRRVVGFLGGFQGSLVTTRWVLMEVADGLADTRKRLSIKSGFEKLEASPIVKVIGFSEPLYQSGLALYAERPDKAWSLTDCISFVVMEQENLREALTGDRHFAQAGFVPMFAD